MSNDPSFTSLAGKINKLKGTSNHPSDMVEGHGDVPTEESVLGCRHWSHLRNIVWTIKDNWAQTHLSFSMSQDGLFQ